MVQITHKSKTMKRGIRNNNPLNIRHGKDRWQGARETQTDRSFVQFESMSYGYRAGWRTLQTYYERFCRQNKPFTVRTIIERWAPPNENDTEAYIRQVLKLAGIGGKENLLPPSNPMGYGKLCRMLVAMTTIECGIPAREVDTSSIAQGYRLAFPEHAKELDEWLQSQDEYRYW